MKQQKNKSLSFVQDFGKCFQNSEWLSFVKHPIRLQKTEVGKLCKHNLYNFDVAVGSIKSAGHLEITPERDEGQLHIFHIASEVQGLGSEMLRRIIYYGHKKNIEKIDASATTYEGAALFWLRSGFLSEGELYPHWYNVEETHSKEAEQWRSRIEENKSVLWEFAATEIGKRVLSDVHFKPVFDYTDEAQRTYVARRFRLPCWRCD